MRVYNQWKFKNTEEKAKKTIPSANSNNVSLTVSTSHSMFDQLTRKGWISQALECALVKKAQKSEYYGGIRYRANYPISSMRLLSQSWFEPG
ncbi:unnamed protein product [Caenorhabditis brenneri]